MILTGNITCENEDEMQVILLELKFVRTAVVTTDGLNIHIEYAPADTESYSESERNAALLADIIESAPNHGISIIKQDALNGE